MLTNCIFQETFCLFLRLPCSGNFQKPDFEKKDLLKRVLPLNLVAKTLDRRNEEITKAEEKELETSNSRTLG